MPLTLRITPDQAKTAAAALRNRAAIVSAELERASVRRAMTAAEQSVKCHELVAVERVAAELLVAAAASTRVAGEGSR